MNVRLFAGYLVRGTSVRPTPSGRLSVYHYPRLPIRVRLAKPHKARRWWFTGHGVQVGFRQGWDGFEMTPQRVFRTILRFGPVLVMFGPKDRESAS